VIDDKTTNAFVVPGGKIFVFTGILPVAANDDGLATIMGHEIAHQGGKARIAAYLDIDKMQYFDTPPSG
jgi:predicted Zn-dependent protease